MIDTQLLCIPKILKNESNSQLTNENTIDEIGCCVSQRYWKMKAIHNYQKIIMSQNLVVVYPKDTEKWKQFTTSYYMAFTQVALLCIPKILKNESNSQRSAKTIYFKDCCCVCQRYWKMKAIHNRNCNKIYKAFVVVYPKDTEKWKQFTTIATGGQKHN